MVSRCSTLARSPEPVRRHNLMLTSLLPVPANTSTTPPSLTHKLQPFGFSVQLLQLVLITLGIAQEILRQWLTMFWFMLSQQAKSQHVVAVFRHKTNIESHTSSGGTLFQKIYGSEERQIILEFRLNWVITHMMFVHWKDNFQTWECCSLL